MLRIFLIHRGLFLVICEMADLLCNGHVRPFPAEFSFFFYTHNNICLGLGFHLITK